MGDLAKGEAMETAAGGRPAFQTLAREQLPRLLSMARRMLGEEGEDAVQDCLLKAYRKYDQLDDPTAAPSWLTTILVNCVRDRVRARARVPEVEVEDMDEFSLYRTIADQDPFPYSDSLHLDFLAGFGPEDLWEVLMRLPEHYRIPLVVVYMEGYKARELAEMMDIPLGTVLARLHRGRKLVERELWTYAEETGLLRGEPAEGVVR